MLRPIMVYAFLVLLLRVFRKRTLAQLNPFDLTVLLMLSNTVQNAIIGRDGSLLVGMIGAAALMVTNYAVVRFAFGHRRLDEIAAGSPTILIKAGRVIRSTLAKELLTVPELQTAAHRQGIVSLSEVDECVLEA
jgi:uncharacterized membrane protein YcaP (DUF421 family)